MCNFKLAPIREIQKGSWRAQFFNIDHVISFFVKENVLKTKYTVCAKFVGEENIEELAIFDSFNDSIYWIIKITGMEDNE